MTDLDQIRARFQPLTRGEYAYVIYERVNAYLFGRVGAQATRWDVEGRCNDGQGDYCDLLPRSPHEELIREARKYIEYAPNCAPLVARLIEALEQEMKK